MRFRAEDGDCDIEVRRICDLYGQAVLAVGTTNAEIQIVVSKGGRSIRVWNAQTGKRLVEADDE